MLSSNSVQQQSKPLNEEIVVRSIKLLDIGYAAMVYFLCAILSVKILNNMSGNFDREQEENKTTWQIMFDIILRIWVIGIFAYIVRNIFHAIPWPFEGIYGYKHMWVKEVINSAVYVAFVVVFDSYLQSQVYLLKRRLGVQSPVYN
jgi:hypothetical protein